ncbi:hypothetical protein KAR91_73215 [Candidatus Pacearchaeota archaeon]|nr:hypothetical protein [Candidatus Pacearchaeota archaeon]
MKKRQLKKKNICKASVWWGEEKVFGPSTKEKCQKWIKRYGPAFKKERGV